MKLPEVRERSLALGVEPAAGAPEALAAFIRSEIPKWSDPVRRRACAD
jgi:tripartite-type tricarboxylate transporter receptor subunit TctC